ncbi:phage tail assembly protein [Acuticoccus sp. M5D2P5]|uniref:phage tail assembly protein n=1 Tax=Acuticoccus kalidii TaxID=2910977 RepID=UPI001F31FA0A|nr:phage tail assembly protein [Acuticoccus kalidii]MCF3935275.1 phage tail assembly protein [Acuticoccus kalidii]
MELKLPNPVNMNGETLTAITLKRTRPLVKDTIAAGDATNPVAEAAWKLASMAEVPRFVIEEQPEEWLISTASQVSAPAGNEEAQTTGETSLVSSAPSSIGAETTS